MKFKFEREYGTFELEGRKWGVNTINEWVQFIPGSHWNWYDFHPVQIHFMRDIAIPGYEVEIILLGLGVRLRVNGDWSTTETGRDLLKFNGDLEETSGECPFCDGTGQVNVIKSKDEQG